MDLMNRQPRVGGNAINYYYTCKTQLWFFLHHITMEDTSEYVELGKLLQENYSEGEEKDIQFDEISLDILRPTKEIIEIKRSKEIKKSHIYQVKYYIYYLKKKYGLTDFKGKLTYPRVHKTYDVYLQPNDEEELENTVEEINNIFYMKTPPKPKMKKICRGCSYFQLCFC